MLSNGGSYGLIKHGEDPTYILEKYFSGASQVRSAPIAIQ